MALLVPDVGEAFLLEKLRDYFNSSGGLHLKLYQNDHTPAAADVVGDYTEADFDGYADVVLNSWPVPIMVGGRALIAEGIVVFEDTGGTTPNDIYGYYVTDVSETELLWAERFAGAPIVVDDIGDQVSVTPTLTLRSEP